MTKAGSDRNNGKPARPHHRTGARSFFRHGLRKGWTGALWMYKIVIPVSFVAFLIDFSGVLDHLQGLLGPVMGFLHLPARAAMPLLAGMLTGIYGGIAAMAVMVFTVKETALIAVFLLISHGLIQESAIQGQSGMHPAKATLIRIAASVIMVRLIGSFWQDGAETASWHMMVEGAASSFSSALAAWASKTLVLSLQILVILIGIMTVIVWMKANRLAGRIAAWLAPVLRLLGLDRQAGLLWLTAALFGISYGAAVIVEETRHGSLPKPELERLHTSIGINHAMIEDPLLFLPFGVHPLWLWLPRLGAALAAVYLLRLYRAIVVRLTAAGI